MDHRLISQCKLQEVGNPVKVDWPRSLWAAFAAVLCRGLLLAGAVDPLGLRSQAVAQAARPPVLEWMRTTPGSVELVATGAAGYALALEQSKNLRSWEEISGTFGDGTAPTLRLALPASAGPAGNVAFYRASLAERPRTTLTNHLGWAETIRLENGQVEVLVVPSIGRIMQFRFRGESGGPFWQNPALLGLGPAPDRWDTPGGFGGDKVWPAPQDGWLWPPPIGFDGSAFDTSISNAVVTMRGPLDAVLGIRVSRRIELAVAQPLMRVTTAFERLAPSIAFYNRVSIWTIAQLEPPQGSFFAPPSPSRYPLGYFIFGPGQGHPAVTRTNGLVSIASSGAGAFKLGSDAGALVWVGSNACLRVEAPRLAGVPYPDGGASTEFYANPEPVSYVEFELLSPLTVLPVGGTLEHTVTYRLYRRTAADPEADARAILGLPP